MTNTIVSKGTRFGVAAIAAATLFAVAGAMRAEEPKAATPSQQSALTHVDHLATAMKNVGKAVEPSVVSIVVEKSTALSALQQRDLRRRSNEAAERMKEQLKQFEEQLRKSFPDNDGDGQPDMPEGFRLPTPDGAEEDDRDDASPRQFRSYGEGSGVILDATADKAYVLTNNHVAGGATKLYVTLADGRRIEDATVIGTDPRTDLAVIEIKGENLTATRWGDSEALEKGDIVLAFGAPFGYVGSMTQGIVSGTNRSSNPRGGVGMLGQGGYEYFIQTDCPINPGNSGGPLVNTRGEIVGINTMIASGSGSFNGLGFAVPSNLAKFVYDQIRAEGKVTRGFLGVQIGNSAALDPRQAERLKLNGKKGAYVSTVQNGTPATGKLRPDDVIVSLDGQPVATSAELRLRIAMTKPEAPVKLGVIRGGKEQFVELKLGTLPDEQPQVATRPEQKEEAGGAEIGATLGDANASRLKGAGLPDDAKGALVTAVKAGSPAQLAGLESGDLITKVNDADVSTGDEAAKAIKAATLKDGVSLHVVNKEGTKSVFVQVEE